MAGKRHDNLDLIFLRFGHFAFKSGVGFRQIVNNYAVMHKAQTSTSRVHLPEMHRAGNVRGMTTPNTLSRDCFTNLDDAHIRVLWSDLETAFDLEGRSNDPPLA